MKKEVYSFKPGEWVILKQSFLEETLKKKLVKGEEIFIRSYCYPQQLQNILQSKNGISFQTLVFSPNKKWMLFGKEFRLATENEIREQQLKNIFVINN